MIPFLFVSCTFLAIHQALNVPTQSVFMLVLLLSDIMALVCLSALTKSHEHVRVITGYFFSLDILLLGSRRRQLVGDRN